MQYLKIQNKGCVFHRKFLEIFGLTTKQDAGPDTIGHKGSGTKFAAIASLRLGLDIAIASTDSLGQFLLRYESDEIDINGTKDHQIMFDYAPSRIVAGKPINERYASGWGIEAFKDWDRKIGDDDKKSFKALREFVCNAIDEDDGFTLTLVDTPDIVPLGYTAVFLRYTREIEDIFKRADRYLKFISGVPDPLFSMPAVGGIYPKSEPGKTRLFVQRVLVSCESGTFRRSIFDYSMRQKTLASEERIIKSYTDYLNQVALLFGQLTDRQMALNILMHVEAGEAEFEDMVLGQVNGITPASAKIWLSALHEMHGEKIAIASGDNDTDLNCFQMHGHKVIARTNARLQRFYAKLGVPKATDIVPDLETFQCEIVSFYGFDQQSQLCFLSAYRRFAPRFPIRAAFPLVFFYPLDEKARAHAGRAIKGEDGTWRLWIATKTRTSLELNERYHYETLVHEGRHGETEKGDYDRGLMDQADRDVSHLEYDPRPEISSTLMPIFAEDIDVEIDIDALFDEVNDSQKK